MTEINEMIPWERDVFMDQLRAYIKDENNRIRNSQNNRFIQNGRF